MKDGCRKKRGGSHSRKVLRSPPWWGDVRNHNNSQENFQVKTMIFQTERSHRCLQTGGAAPTSQLQGRRSRREGPLTSSSPSCTCHREGRPEAGKGHGDPGEGSGALSEAGGLTHSPTQQLTPEKTKTGTAGETGSLHRLGSEPYSVMKT